MQKKLDTKNKDAQTINDKIMNQKTALKVGTGKELKTWQTHKHYR